MKRTDVRERIELEAEDLFDLTAGNRVVGEDVEVVVPEEEYMQYVVMLDNLDRDQKA